jgi:signal transduction histidine kinase
VVDDLTGAFRKESEIHFYRIVQESLNNAIKHANASEITVLAERKDRRVSLLITDDGVGFVTDGSTSAATKAGFGLTGLVERAHLLGGTASIRSVPGQGTTVNIEIQTEADGTARQEPGTDAWQMRSA